jgi:hypothetical protein
MNNEDELYVKRKARNIIENAGYRLDPRYAPRILHIVNGIIKVECRIDNGKSTIIGVVNPVEKVEKYNSIW